VYPVLHVQAVMMPLPITDTVLLGQLSHVAAAVAATAVENVCTPQLVHAAGPGATLYLPAEHAPHTMSPLDSHKGVKSIPDIILLWITVIALFIINSSTKNMPATSPSKPGSQEDVVPPVKIDTATPLTRLPSFIIPGNPLAVTGTASLMVTESTNETVLYVTVIRIHCVTSVAVASTTANSPKSSPVAADIFPSAGVTHTRNQHPSRFKPNTVPRSEDRLEVRRITIASVTPPFVFGLTET
jgi:hypothetical protein